MTDSNDDSNAVTVHISKHSQVPDRQTGRERRGEGRGGGCNKINKVSKKISDSSRGKKYKLKSHLHPVLFTADNHIEKMSR